ncbi:MAG: glycosyltransferase family 2 protein [Rhodoblastus sp.]|nr:glycosyltransferase family 2 protein [Rhodoblastus sp.]MCO5086388.1 glycosyltransferase [Methylobacteriaceae bacterium]
MLYSFVIPTRERHDVLGAAMRAVLAQTRDNLELVVMDNASSSATKDVIDSFNDPRIRHVRAPERLPMIDNWEMGLAQARGDYVTILGDDDGPLPDALEVAEKVHAVWPDKILTWRISVYYWPDFYIPEFRNQANVHLGRHLELRNSRDFLRKLYTYKDQANFSELPSLYYSFVPRPLIDRIRTKYGRYFLSKSPDIASGLVNAWHVDDYVFSYRPVSVLGISRHSTGTSALFPGLHAGPAEQFKAENAAAIPEDLDPRLSDKTYLLEVFVANELARFRDKYFPDDAIKPDMAAWLQWFATAAPRFGDKRGELEALIEEIARKNGLSADRVKMPPAQDMSKASSFLYFVGKHQSVFFRYTIGPHIADIAQMTAEYARMATPVDEIVVPSATRVSARDRIARLLQRR